MLKKVFFIFLTFNFSCILRAQTLLQNQNCSSADSQEVDQCKCDSIDGICVTSLKTNKLYCDCETSNVYNNQELLDLAVNAINKYWAENPDKRDEWLVRVKNAIKGSLRLNKDFWSYAKDLPEALKIEIQDSSGCTDKVTMFPTDRACAGLHADATCKCPDGSDGICWVSKVPQKNVNGENIASNTLFCNCEQ